MGLGIYGGFNTSKLFGPVTFNMGLSPEFSGVTNPLFSSFNQYAVQPGTQGGAGTSTTTEAHVSSYIKELVNDNDLKKNFSEKIGNSKKTYAERLSELMEDYATSKNSPLTEAQYKQIKSIAATYNAVGATYFEENPEKIKLLKEIVYETKDMTLGAVVDQQEEQAIQQEEEAAAKEIEEEETKTNAAAQYPVYTQLDGVDAASIVETNDYNCIAGEWKDGQTKATKDLNKKAKSYMTELKKQIKEQVELNAQKWTPEMEKAANESIKELMPTSDNIESAAEIIVGHQYTNAKCDYQKLDLGKHDNGKSVIRHYGIDVKGAFCKDYSAIINVESLAADFQARFNKKCLANAQKIDKDFKPES